MREPWAFLVGFAVVAVTFGGCVGTTTSGEASAASASATVDAGNDAALSDVGTLEGQVTDDEKRPLEAVRVGVAKLDVFALTDAGGRFTVLNVAAGAYDVFAEKLGFESRASRVVVETGKTTTVSFILVPLAVEEVHYVVDRYSTILECMLQSFVWVSTCSWPYELVYLTAHRNGVNLSQYGLPPDIQRNKFRHDVTLTAGAQAVVGELEWKATTDLAKRLRIVDCREYDQVQDTCLGKHHPDFKGESPIRGQWKLPKELKPKEGKTTKYVSAVWLDWGTLTQVGLVFEQKIELYNTIFFQGEPPEEWSIFPPGG